MTRTLLTITLSACFAISMMACKTDESGSKPEDTAQATPTEEPAATDAPPVAESQPAAGIRPAEGVEPPEDDDRPFGQIVEGTSAITVTQELADDEIDFGGKTRTTTEADVIAKMVEAIGTDTAGNQDLPKCIPHYSFEFAREGGKDPAVFSGVCSGNDVVIMVRNGRAYQAKDGAAVQAILKELADMPEP